MKKILFPFETNQDIYKEAYVYAVKFARNLGAELIMLNVFEIDDEDATTTQKYRKMVRDKYFMAYQEIIKFNKHYLGHYAKPEPELRIKVDYRFLHGNLIQVLTQIISTEDIDLVVLPEAHQKELYHWIVEVIWQDLVKTYPVSLLLIPSGCHYEHIISTSFVADMKNLDHIALYVNDVLRYSKVFDANVHFLNISQGKKTHPTEEGTPFEKLTQLIESSHKHVFSELIGKDIVRLIEEYTKNNSVQLVFVVRHHHYFLDSLFHKDLSDKICLRSRIPVLVMKARTD
jgi:nucleotide-binding universal stress UspA family protein